MHGPLVSRKVVEEGKFLHVITMVTTMPKCIHLLHSDSYVDLTVRVMSSQLQGKDP